MNIGILSYYYQNNNYGGLLQAYAMCAAAGKQAYSAAVEQVTIPARAPNPPQSLAAKLKKALNPAKLFKYLFQHGRKALNRPNQQKIANGLALRNADFRSFMDEIPHSEKVYSVSTISEIADKYDLLISGSDQVWNYAWLNPVFFLGFSDTYRISYAASMGHSDLPEPWYSQYKELLKNFDAISVREENMVSLLQPIAPVPVEWVLDPTLLLSASDWDEICAPRQIEEPYLFCYYLGGSQRDRMLANEVAKRKGLKIVTLPHLLGEYRKVDKDFGDIQLWDVSPKQFISLIKYADFVMTDSFHGSVFSGVYGRPFVAFEREGEKGMSGRLLSLTEITDTQDRFLTTPDKLTADYICALPYALPPETEKMRLMREKSLGFLKRNIEAAEKRKGENAKS